MCRKWTRKRSGPVIRPRIAPDNPLSVIRFVRGGGGPLKRTTSWEAAANGRHARGPIRGSASRLRIQLRFQRIDRSKDSFETRVSGQQKEREGSRSEFNRGKMEEVPPSDNNKKKRSKLCHIAAAHEAWVTASRCFFARGVSVVRLGASGATG